MHKNDEYENTDMTAESDLDSSVVFGLIELAWLGLIRTGKTTRSDQTVATLGDYVNRDPDSRGGIDRLIVLQSECELTPLPGDHHQPLPHNRSARGETEGLWHCRF